MSSASTLSTLCLFGYLNVTHSALFQTTYRLQQHRVKIIAGTSPTPPPPPCPPLCPSHPAITSSSSAVLISHPTSTQSSSSALSTASNPRRETPVWVCESHTTDVEQPQMVCRHVRSRSTRSTFEHYQVLISKYVQLHPACLTTVVYDHCMCLHRARRHDSCRTYASVRRCCTEAPRQLG